MPLLQLAEQVTASAYTRCKQLDLSHRATVLLSRHACVDCKAIVTFCAVAARFNPKHTTARSQHAAAAA